MIRLSLYILLAILLAFAAVWLVDHPGRVLFNWRGWEIHLSVATFGLLLFLYTLLWWSLFRLGRWLTADNPLKSPRRQASRRQKGLQQLDQGWAALAVADRTAARAHGKKAASLLPDHGGPCRLLLEVTEGKEREACLAALENNPDTRLIALRARLDERLSEGDDPAAHHILHEMQALAPDAPWVGRQMFEIAARREQWTTAREALKRLLKARTIDDAEQRHLLAVICHKQALEEDLSGHRDAAQDLAREALKNDPAFLPAALFLARNYLSHDDRARARKVIENAWKRAPHPDLGQLFASLEPLESAGEKFRRILKFTDLQKDHPHSLHLRAKVAMDSAHWAEARQALDRLFALDRASRETYILRARLEGEQKNDDAAADKFLSRAASAPADPEWRCANCQASLKAYKATCPRCHAFGRVTWPGTPAA